MIVIGLTGSIGMGKTATAGLFAKLGIPVYDADAAVHELYDVGGAAVEPVGAAFPGVVKNGAIDRQALGAIVVGYPEEMARLEAIVHPLVGQAREIWMQGAVVAGADMVVLDVPLLFETGGDAFVDVVVVVSAPADVQRTRVLERPGMTEEKFNAIFAKQTPDAEKRARADYIIETDKGLDDAFGQVKTIVTAIRGRNG
jgi:dephospho-CoA kinase